MSLGAILMGVAAAVVLGVYIAQPFRRRVDNLDALIEAWAAQEGTEHPSREAREAPREAPPAVNAQPRRAEKISPPPTPVTPPPQEEAARLDADCVDTAATKLPSSEPEGASAKTKATPAEEAVNFCHQCGQRVQPHHRFCPHCGTRLVEG